MNKRKSRRNYWKQKHLGKMAKVELRGCLEIKTWAFHDTVWMNQLFQQKTGKIGTFRLLGNLASELISPEKTHFQTAS
ncbi:MAG: hypothetical protein NZ602_14445 [Thermoguttaceae bacterium]|nr:hypothetical protein [Thermoguttaceae bacterium]MDW8037534.1 hypothetical protein [Thermoguttaceae bacterium]